MTKMRSSAVERRASSSVEPAVVTAVEEDGRLAVRTGVGTGTTRRAVARLAHLPGYEPQPGDRVLVAQGPDALYAIAVLHVAAPRPTPSPAHAPAHTPAHAPEVALTDGSTATVVEDGIEIRNPEGRLIVRYAGGTAEITAPGRDLVLSAPNGQVKLQAGTDISFEATRDLVQSAGRKVALGAGASAASAPQIRVESQATQLRAERLEVQSKTSRFVSGRAEVLLRTLATTAEKVALHVTDHEVTATRLVERATEAFREVKDLLSTRAGRARTEVEGAYTVESGRTSLVSREETTVDGKKILLG